MSWKKIIWENSREYFYRTYAVQCISVIATDREAISNPSFSYLMRKSCSSQNLIDEKYQESRPLIFQLDKISNLIILAFLSFAIWENSREYF